MDKITGCHVMVKPTGSVCNIDCSYCFYLEKEALYPDRNNNWRMSDETLETYIIQHIAAQSGEHVDFSWQGGEPTLMGISFFKKAVALCKQYANGKIIHHSLQTNGILLNDEWGAFLAKHNFLIGLSIDGPQHLHDKYRKTRSGKGTYSQVMGAINILKKYNIEFNTLTVVGQHNAQYAKEVYQFLISIGSRHMQFIPLVERISNAPEPPSLKLVMPGESMATLAPWSVPSWQFGEFLNQIFDVWVRRDIGQISVQMFDIALNVWCGQPAGLCVLSPTCGHAFALESNGDLYNCDHFVYPEHKLGNIHIKTITEMNNSNAAIAFGLSKAESLTTDCRNCEYLAACYGGCPKHRFAISPSGEIGHNYLCKGYKHFFKHVDPYLQKMQKLLVAGYPASTLMQHLIIDTPLQTGKKGRNEPCPCNSGKKFKKCCGK
ncbi:anaerobic sulfatase maturase [Vibrio sp. TH_r3]|uniref:anaerobic sulfatase maturase n=1 Tax=Vibrio sp. TH_r3 TaxID=3082084 RepID=UPI002952A22C|nr:anaerobic sulfatase maturase [Vibrio sp. TH_r3]MDV7105128.1 anaerobic sulfatase maturase [Vibrio sp. TH_r3]